MDILKKNGKTLLIFLLKLFHAVMAKSRTAPESPRSILILMCHWLGDTFWAMQGIPALQQKYPDARIYAAVKPFSVPLFHGILPEKDVLIFKGIISDRTREKFRFFHFFRNLKTARSLHPDLVIDLTGNRYSALFARFLGGKSYLAGPDPADELSFLYSRRIAIPDSLPDLTRKPKIILEAITGTVLPETLFPPQASIPVEELQKRYQLGKNESLVMIAPGAGWQAKQWPAEKFQALAESLEKQGFRVLISGSAGEDSLLQQVSRNLKNGIILKDSLAISISFLPHLKVFIGNDSGLTNLAAANKIPVLAFFCSTSPSFLGFGGNVITLCSACTEAPDQISQFCHTPPRQFCSRPSFMAIPVEQVNAILKELL